MQITVELKTKLVLFLTLGLTLVGSVGLDQCTKQHAQTSLLIWEDPGNTDYFRGGKFPVFLIGNKFSPESRFHFAMNYQYSRNKGAAFSLLADVPDQVRVPFFYGVTILAAILIFLYLRSTPLTQPISRYGLILILAGAVGNFVDRLRHGYVIDFIDVDWNLFGWRHDFAIFNIADVSINIGVICLILDMIVQKKKEKQLKSRVYQANKKVTA